MDWIELGSKAIEHLAWPVAVVYLLRPQKAAITELIGRIKKVEGPGGFKAEIADAAKELKDQATELAAKPVEPPKLEAVAAASAAIAGAGTAKSEGSATFPVGDSASLSPNLHITSRTVALEDIDKIRDERLRASGSILEDWGLVEGTVRSIATTHGFEDAYKKPMGFSLGSLRAKQIISDETADLINDLKELRNQVAHTTLEPSRKAAADFTLSCRKVMTRMVNEERAWEEVQKLAKAWEEQAKLKK